MKIGYQGDFFSNSEEAAHLLVKKRGIQNAIFIPLISSQNVINALKNKEIDFGVMAIQNKIAGPVLETSLALTKEYEQIDTLALPIHHCLFKKTKTSAINVVTSHIQALLQTKNYRKKFFPYLQEIESEDTALAAKKLSTGEISDSHAIICRKNAGLFYGLFLIKENIEDDKKNETTFGLFQLKNEK